MWQNNGIQGHGNFENGQGNYQLSYGGDDGFIPFSPGPQSQQYFQVQHLMPYTEIGDGYMSGDFQPEAGPYNNESFMQNQYVSSDDPEQYISQQSNTTGRSTPRQALNARAEELKAKLLKKKEERAKSGTPPLIPGLSSKSLNQVDGTSSLRESPITPGSTPVLRRTTSRAVSVTADDLDDLLTEGKAAADAANVNKESNYSNSDISKPQQHFKTPNQQIRSPISTPATSTKVQKQIVDFNRNDSKPTGKPSSKPENVESSDASEGEILEKPKPILKPKTTQPPSGAKETQTIIGKSVKEQVVRNPRDAQAGQTSRDSDSGGTSPRRRGSLQHSGPSLSRNRDNRQQSVEGKIDKKAYGTSYKYEPSNQPETGQIQYQRRDPLETSGEPRKYEIKYESRGEDSPSKSNVPTLTDLLFVDADLREWLAITRYHDTEYRNKTLNRRRAIAALDAQKAKLLEEMERDERGVAANVSQGTLAAMLPPPAPSHPLTAVAKEKAALLPENTERPVSRPVKQEAGNKRTYSDYQSPRADGGAEKIGRLDELGRGIRSRSENGAEDRRPYSSGYDGSRRRSPPIESNPSRREDIDYYRHQSEERGSGRGRGRGRGYDRESSPGLQAVHGRPPVRSFSPGQDDYRDRGEGKHSRPYVVRGNYRGRDYDPNYRGRGRGRGSWGNSNEIDSRQPYEQGHSDSHRIVNGKPSKDSKVWDKGGKGETRYFIVKSFNEQNVIRCMEDSIWTTQVQNGEIFKQAFLTCKNVILVFSINQSRAFQGYARMESLPGNEEAPQWQKNINWESAGAFRVAWICIASTRFSRVGHLKNALNDNQAVLIGKDGQEIEERCGEELINLIDEEAERFGERDRRYREPGQAPWDH